MKLSTNESKAWINLLIAGAAVVPGSGARPVLPSEPGDLDVAVRGGGRVGAGHDLALGGLGSPPASRVAPDLNTEM